MVIKLQYVLQITKTEYGRSGIQPESQKLGLAVAMTYELRRGRL